MSEEIDQSTEINNNPDVIEAKVDTVAADQQKTVKFEETDLTFEEAQAEIDSMKERAGRVKESLRSSHSPSYESSTSISNAMEHDLPKSKNILAHLNSHSALHNYKVQNARILVRKQEELLRNLARMRENMERSENEIDKAANYYITSKALSKRIGRSAEPIRRSYSDSIYASNTSIDAEKNGPTLTTTSSGYSSASRVLTGLTDYKPDEDFEREMETIRKRVADLTRKANEVTTRKSVYDEYLNDSSVLTSKYLRDFDDSRYLKDMDDSYKLPESRYEVNYPSKTNYLPARSVVPNVPVSLCEPIPSYLETSNAYPTTSNSYSNYVLDSLNEYSHPETLNGYGIYDYPMHSGSEFSVAY